MRRLAEFTRYAVYATPRPGLLATFGAKWLGWDAASGTACTQMVLPELPTPLEHITATPRNYGFHGTLKAPFRLSPETGQTDLVLAFRALGQTLAPVALGKLQLTRIGQFLALTPVVGKQAALAALATHVVETLDRFRAPLTDAELARRRTAGLTAEQDDFLCRWGYPYVGPEFRFHLTLTGAIEDGTLASTQKVLALHLAPILEKPLFLEDLTLVGEDAAGRFHHIERAVLSG